MARRPFVPDRGDIVWLQFNPQAGHEQASHRPALVVSPKSYNQKTGLALMCPVTTNIKGYPFEVVLPDGLEVRGAVLSDQIKNLDWRIRQAKRICEAPASVTNEVTAKLRVLIDDT